MAVVDSDAAFAHKLAEVLGGGGEERAKTHRATVSRVDADGTVWVRMLGADADTPVSASAVTVQDGDVVAVTIENGRATLDANVSSPVTSTAYVEEVRAGLAGDVSAANQRITHVEGDIVTAIHGVAELETLIREYEDGVLVCREGNTIGALVNADGSFDVVAVTWDEDGVPTAGAKLNNVAATGMELYDADGNSIAEFSKNKARIGMVDGQHVEVDSSGLHLLNPDGTHANVVNDEQTWSEVNVSPASATSFYVPAAAVSTMELVIAGNYVPDPYGDGTYAADRYGHIDYSSRSSVIAPARLFKAQPTAVNVTGRDSEGHEQTVTITVPSFGDGGTSIGAGNGLLRASYERGADGQSLLHDDLVLSRMDGIYIRRRFGLEYIDDPHGYLTWISDERTQMALDGTPLPGAVVTLPIMAQSAWNNGLVPAWYADPVDKGYALLSTFSHPLELNYYRCPAVGDLPAADMLVVNPFYNPSELYQTNLDTFADILNRGGAGEDIASLINFMLYEGDYIGGSYVAPLFYALSTSQIEYVNRAWRWPTLPVSPLDSSGYLVELVYGEVVINDFLSPWDGDWDRHEGERAVTVRWRAGTLDERLAVKLDAADAITDYGDLTGKPSIETVTLIGDRSFPDLGIFIDPTADPVEDHPASDDYALTTLDINALWNAAAI